MVKILLSPRGDHNYSLEKYFRHRFHITLTFVLESWFKVTEYLLPKGVICARLQQGERKYVLEKLSQRDRC